MRNKLEVGSHREIFVIFVPMISFFVDQLKFKCLSNTIWQWRQIYAGFNFRINGILVQVVGYLLLFKLHCQQLLSIFDPLFILRLILYEPFQVYVCKSAIATYVIRPLYDSCCSLHECLIIASLAGISLSTGLAIAIPFFIQPSIKLFLVFKIYSSSIFTRLIFNYLIMNFETESYICKKQNTIMHSRESISNTNKKFSFFYNSLSSWLNFVFGIYSYIIIKNIIKFILLLTKSLF